jgi:hypothetical protein
VAGVGRATCCTNRQSRKSILGNGLGDMSNDAMGLYGRKPIQSVPRQCVAAFFSISYIGCIRAQPTTIINDT